MRFLEGKTAIITGSTSGIGLAIAHSLAEVGANITLNGFGDMAEIQKTVLDIQNKHKVKVHYASGDVSKTADVQKMVDSTVAAFGRIDIMVNNAGIQYVAPISEFPEEKWDSIIAINLSAAFRTIKATLPFMQKQGWGRIVNIASAHGLVASPFKSAYVSAKHGLLGLTKTVAVETAESNITCNAICPGYVKTPLVEHQIAEQAKAHNIPEDRVIKEIILHAQPNKKFIHAEHLGKLVAFLCSDAGEGMTGEIIAVDGGWTAQ